MKRRLRIQHNQERTGHSYGRNKLLTLFVLGAAFGFLAGMAGANLLQIMGVSLNSLMIFCGIASIVILVVLLRVLRWQE